MAKDAKTRAKARVRYESGHSSRDIAEELGLDRKTVEAWAQKEEWVKGSLGPKLVQKEEEATLEIARSLGLDKAYFLGKVKTLCEATRPVLVKGDKDEEAEAKEEGDESGGAFVQEIPDYKAISDGLTHAERIIPKLKVNEKLDIEAGDDLRSLFQSMRGTP